MLQRCSKELFIAWRKAHPYAFRIENAYFFENDMHVYARLVKNKKKLNFWIDLPIEMHPCYIPRK